MTHNTGIDPDAYCYAREIRYRQNAVSAILTGEARRNVYVAQHIKAWENGAFATFEEMLVQLCLTLLRVNAQLMEILERPTR